MQIPNSVTSIGILAFAGCKSLTSIQIPNSVTTINYAFTECKSLTSIQIPNSVKTIGEGAFYACTSLTSVKIPDSVTTIGEEAFRDCESLTSIQIPESTILGEDVFKGCKPSLQILRVPNTKKARKAKNSVANTGCIVPSVIFVYDIYWITKSIGNFLFG
ncbi:MAG: leucine-rich repeat domain-containing protein [Selenomonadaceae bacterium]|nr:leucine-rich repeat domain-containing protein [Selenomonadaceae bacterium]